VNKKDILQKLIESLRGLLEAGTRAARASGEAATDPDSKAENKYDTRNLEASYLARGQAFRVAETMEALREIEVFRPRAFAADEAIAMGALVTISGRDGKFRCLLCPAAGGTEVTVHGEEVLIITPSSPLAAKLSGRKKGDRVEMQSGRPASVAAIVGVE
jgi:transcription elongation GreA/GreB family factor